MPALHEKLRKQLEKTVIAARDIAEEAATEALKRLAVDQPKLFGHMTPEERELRNKLRAKARQLGDRRDKAGKQAIDHLAVECAYEHWHRMLFARFLSENHLLIHDKEGVPVSLEECEELAKDEGIDGWTLAARFASRMLPQIFRPDDPVLAVTLAPESKRALEKMLDTLPPDVFTADDSLGWVYQFWQDKRKDEVNASGVKIGADELPAVTQLFTEHYMVLFLLHNTLGAWWAGKVLGGAAGGEQELSEDEWRRRVALPGCDFEYLRFLPNGTPAAGTFSGWPQEAKDLKILDPCCGSGHFLVAAFDLMVRIRMKEEGLSPGDASDAVLRDNIFGLEIDPRCTQIAAFALAFSAWRFPEAGGYRELPELQIACSGMSMGGRKEEWVSLANGDDRLKHGMVRLYELFQQAPALGSLVDPRRLLAYTDGQRDELPLGDAFAELRPLLKEVLTHEGVMADPARSLAGVVAQGMVLAAELLSCSYTLVLTNVPYLGSRRQDAPLKEFCSTRYPNSKSDLATVFLERSFHLCASDGVFATVTPQNWLFLTSYKEFRCDLLRQATWHLVARLGPGAFDTISGEVVKSSLVILSRKEPPPDSALSGVDATAALKSSGKSAFLCSETLDVALQQQLLENPDCRIVFGTVEDLPLLSSYVITPQGIKTGDDEKWRRRHWEISQIVGGWERYQSSVKETQPFGGREFIIDWRTNGKGMVRPRLGNEAVGKAGVASGTIGNLPVTLYFGQRYESSIAPLVPQDQSLVKAIWAFCKSSEYRGAVRRIDQKLAVTSDTLAKIPFDLEFWKKTADESAPLPEPFSDDPTQWLFDGRVASSRHPLQVATGRLLGYEWPAQAVDGLEDQVDGDGIVCIPAARGERVAADRVRAVLAMAYDDWSPAKQEELLASVGYGGRNLDEWLRNGFFEQHYKLFHHRPFIWHIWDGRKKDGFGALVNYHKLDAKLLDRLIYTYLGDWITRQKQEEDRGESGADGRRVAAEQLQEKLKLIAKGEPPYDIFVRWKPIEEQAIGWNPDLNDGVRMNIRPFVEANILRKKPNIKWKKDRGKEPERPREQYPWFYDENGEFTGDRVNDVHLTNAEKKAAQTATCRNPSN